MNNFIFITEYRGTKGGQKHRKNTEENQVTKMTNIFKAILNATKDD